MVVGLKNYRKNKRGAMLIWNPRVVNQLHIKKTMNEKVSGLLEIWEKENGIHRQG